MTACIAPGCRQPRIATPQGQPTAFCAQHVTAPPGARGGWISAHRRAQARANAERPLDASLVYDRLWMGGKPPADRALPLFGAVVLCAAEYQPRMAFPGPVIRCPLDDAVPTPGEVAMATAASRQVAQLWRGGARVLVTCYAGLNRSGLVTALALLQVSRRRAGDVVELVRRARGPHALGNRHFVAVIERLEPPGRARPR